MIAPTVTTAPYSDRIDVTVEDVGIFEELIHPLIRLTPNADGNPATPFSERYVCPYRSNVGDNPIPTNVFVKGLAIGTEMLNSEKSGPLGPVAVVFGH